MSVAGDGAMKAGSRRRTVCNPCNPYVNIICMNPTYEPISASSKLDF